MATLILFPMNLNASSNAMGAIIPSKATIIIECDPNSIIHPLSYANFEVLTGF